MMMITPFNMLMMNVALIAVNIDVELQLKVWDDVDYELLDIIIMCLEHIKWQLLTSNPTSHQPTWQFYILF